MRKYIWKILFVLYLAAVAYICFAGQGGLPKLMEWHFPIPADKCVHFLMFLPFPLLGTMAVLPHNHTVIPSAVEESPRRDPRVILILLGMILLGCAIAGTTELVQGLIPDRSKDVYDFIADCLGLLTGALLFSAFYPCLRK